MSRRPPPCPPQVDAPILDLREDVASIPPAQPVEPAEPSTAVAPPAEKPVPDMSLGTDGTVDMVDAPAQPKQEAAGDQMDTSEDPALPHRMAAQDSDVVENVPVEQSLEVKPVSTSEGGNPDHEMQDAPPSAKLSRSREEDEATSVPSAKRARTDEQEPAQPEFKVPNVPAASGAEAPIGNGSATAPAPASEASPHPNSIHPPPVFDDTPMTRAQHKFLQDRLRNSKKIKCAQAFLLPVDPQALGIPTYPDVIKHPMDISTMEAKLKQDQYTTINQFLADFDQMVQNSILFNGPNHAVSINGMNLKAYFNKSLADMPKATANATEPEAAPAPKKQKRPTITTNAAQKPSRRESKAAPAPSPAANAGGAGSPQSTYALQPDGLPLIRRDSTVGDGRPKREIHRPPPRDLPYSAKPKKKKFQLELRFCETVVTEMNKKRHQHISYPFMQPVDPVALNIPTYHKVIKKPMDFGTITTKLKNGHYENAKEFHADVKLMFDNCFKFNPEKDNVHTMGKDFQAVFDALWAKKDDWLAEHAPPSGPQSPGTAESDEEEDDVEDDEEDRQAKLLEIQQQIFQLSAEAQKIFQPRNKRTSPKVGGGSKRASGGVKGSSKNATSKSSKKASASGTGGAGAKASSSKPKKSKLAPITHAQKQEIADAISGLQGEDMMNAVQIIRNGVPLKVGYS